MMRPHAPSVASRVLAVTVLGSLLAIPPAGSAQTKAEVDAALAAAHAKYKGLKEGKNADYIPALAKVPSKLFGIALVTVDGQVYTAGDVEQLFSIQSISKVFTMAEVMQESGEKAVEDSVGVDATGQVFNSIVAVEKYKGHEMNALREPGRDRDDQHGEGRERGRGLGEDHRHLQRLRRPPARGEPGGLQVRVGHQPAQPGDRHAHVRLRPHQGEPGAGDRPLHAPVLDQRQREGPGDHGGDARQRRDESRSPRRRSSTRSTSRASSP